MPTTNKFTEDETLFIEKYDELALLVLDHTQWDVPKAQEMMDSKYLGIITDEALSLIKNKEHLQIHVGENRHVFKI